MAHYAILHIPTGTVIRKCPAVSTVIAVPNSFVDFLWEYSPETQRSRPSKYFYDRASAEKYLRKLLYVYKCKDLSKRFRKPRKRRTSVAAVPLTVRYYRNHISKSLFRYMFIGFSELLRPEWSDFFHLSKKEFCVFQVIDGL